MYTLTIKQNGKKITTTHASFEAAWAARKSSKSVFWQIDKV
jgi:hypothetical protein